MFSLPRVQDQPLVGELRFCKGEKKKKERKEGRERVRKGGKKERREGRKIFLKACLAPSGPVA